MENFQEEIDSLNSDLKQRLSGKLDEVIYSFKQNSENYLTKERLMPVYKERLQEYVEMAYSSDHLKEKFIEEMLKKLGNSIEESDVEQTDGKDKIVCSIAAVELAKTIYKEGDYSTSETIDKGRDSLRIATLWLYGTSEASKKNIKKLLKELKKFIYRNTSQNSSD